MPGLTQVRPGLLVLVYDGPFGEGPHFIEYERRSVLPNQVAHKLGPYRRMASLGRPLPLLMVCETEQGGRVLEASAGELPMLTATQGQTFAGPLTGPVMVWRRDGVPAALHCRR